MKISIITVSYNSAATIKDTIDCVLAQNYPQVEYIIIDGASKDGTCDIVRSYGDRIDFFRSEPDQGIYDAMNKGLQKATGEVVGILNSDDFYAHEGVLSQVMSIFEEEEVDSVYGDLQYIDPIQTEKVVRNWKAGPFELEKFLYGWMPPHPAFFVRRSCYLRWGLFDESFLLAADYELMLRFLYKYQISTYYLPEVLVKMRTGGTSNASLRNRLNANREDRLAWEKNGLTPKFYTTWLKPVRKIHQFIRS